ncbi:MAG: hypothetical protein HC850_14410 [Rhodomicrobium sp.]|nr:hypothetical protein [Rhodomicrobium sp.]
MVAELGAGKYPENPDLYSEDTASRLYALNHFRAGLIETGLIILGRTKPKGLDSRFPVPSYDHKTKGSAFHKAMREMARMLESHGL